MTRARRMTDLDPGRLRRVRYRTSNAHTARRTSHLPNDRLEQRALPTSHLTEIVSVTLQLQACIVAYAANHCDERSRFDVERDVVELEWLQLALKFSKLVGRHAFAPLRQNGRIRLVFGFCGFLVGLSWARVRAAMFPRERAMYRQSACRVVGRYRDGPSLLREKQLPDATKGDKAVAELRKTSVAGSEHGETYGSGGQWK